MRKSAALFTVALALMLFLKYRTRHGIARVAEARG